jgi:hypothetical protein
VLMPGGWCLALRSTGGPPPPLVRLLATGWQAIDPEPMAGG